MTSARLAQLKEGLAQQLAHAAGLAIPNSVVAIPVMRFKSFGLVGMLGAKFRASSRWLLLFKPVLGLLAFTTFSGQLVAGYLPSTLQPPKVVREFRGAWVTSSQ